MPNQGRSDDPNVVDWSEEVQLTLKDGTSLTIRRDEAGDMEICHEKACLTIPATAPEFLSFLEFFRTMGG